MNIYYHYPPGHAVGPTSLNNPQPTSFQTSPMGSEVSLVEQLLRHNKGKIANVYMHFDDSQWGSKVFRGEILGSGSDHLLLRDNKAGITYVLLTVFLSYITFEDIVEAT